MKLSYLSVGLLTLLTPLTAAWSKEDREIFRIRDEISAHETDPDATFYDILGIKPSASQDDINKAYRMKTRSLHPDKVTQQLRAERTKARKAGKDGSGKPPSQSEINKAVTEASDRQARLSLIAGILRGAGRERYDYFVNYGFPLWKGTDYYYNRYRPGLGTAMFGVFLVAGGAVHYLVLYMNWKKQTEFIGRYIKFARDTAWGGNLGIPGVDAEPAPAPAPAQESEDGPPQAMNRRQRRMQEKEAKTKREDNRGGRKKALKSQSTSASASRETSAKPTGRRKRVVAENGKVLVVDSVGNVYLEEEDKEGVVHEFLLDPNELPKPTALDTAVVRVPLWVFNSTVGRLLPQKAEEFESDSVVDDEDSDSPQHTPTTDSAGEDFEMVDKSTDSLGKAKTTGAQQGGGKANKRKGRKR